MSERKYTRHEMVTAACSLANIGHSPNWGDRLCDEADRMREKAEGVWVRPGDSVTDGDSTRIVVGRSQNSKLLLNTLNASCFHTKIDYLHTLDGRPVLGVRSGEFTEEEAREMMRRAARWEAEALGKSRAAIWLPECEERFLREIREARNA